MKTFYKILLIIIALAYLISPIDLIPDFMIPYVGWLDDAFIVGLILYYLKFNRLPSFFSRHGKPNQNRENTFNRYNNHYNDSYFSNNNQGQGQNRNGNGSARSNNDNNNYRDKNESDNENQYQSRNRNQNERRTYDHGTGSKTYNESTHGTKSKRTPYDVLGVGINATKEEIHAAYRKLVKQYHPDRVAHLGKEFQDLANKKFIEIKDAYNTLMKS